MAKLARLLNLTAALLETTVPMTADEIRSRVEGYPKSDQAFHRSFERDKDDLRELGVPLETVTVEHHELPKSAYTINRRRYELRDPGFTPQELAALQIARTAVMFEGIDADEVEDTFRKLGGVDPNAADATPSGTIEISDELGVIYEAIRQRRKIDFTYASAIRHVEPVALHFERGRWYLSAYDLDREGMRNFRTDRIEGKISTGDPGSCGIRHEEPNLVISPWAAGTGEAVRTVIHIERDPSQATLSEYPDLVIVDHLTDASVIVEMDVRSAEGLYGFMARLLEKAEILEPRSMLDGYVEWLLLRAQSGEHGQGTDEVTQ